MLLASHAIEQLQTKPSLIIIAEPQSYQLLLAGSLFMGVLLLWQYFSK